MSSLAQSDADESNSTNSTQNLSINFLKSKHQINKFIFTDIHTSFEISKFRRQFEILLQYHYMIEAKANFKQKQLQKIANQPRSLNGLNETLRAVQNDDIKHKIVFLAKNLCFKDEKQEQQLSQLKKLCLEKHIPLIDIFTRDELGAFFDSQYRLISQKKSPSKSSALIIIEVSHIYHQLMQITKLMYPQRVQPAKDDDEEDIIDCTQLQSEFKKFQDILDETKSMSHNKTNEYFVQRFIKHQKLPQIIMLSEQCYKIKK